MPLNTLYTIEYVTCTYLFNWPFFWQRKMPKYNQSLVKCKQDSIFWLPLEMDSLCSKASLDIQNNEFYFISSEIPCIHILVLWNPAKKIIFWCLGLGERLGRSRKPPYSSKIICSAYKVHGKWLVRVLKSFARDIIQNVRRFADSVWWLKFWHILARLKNSNHDRSNWSPTTKKVSFFSQM